MRFKRAFLPLFCLAFICCLLIGNGFALFFFGNGNTESEDGNVDIVVEDHIELGSVTLIDRGIYSYQIFFDTDSLYLFRSDNPTKDAELELSCSFSDTVNIPSGYNVGLVCDVTLTDTDGRGVKKGVFSDGSGSYVYSDSILDYFAPSKSVGTVGEDNIFTLIDGNESSKSLTYRCVLFDNVYTPSGNYDTGSFGLKFSYNDYDMTDGTNTYHGNISPAVNFDSLEEYKEVMAAAKNSMKNAEVSIVFRLILQKDVG